MIRPTRADPSPEGPVISLLPWPRPIRAVQRARLCAIQYPSQAPLAAKRRHVVQLSCIWRRPTPYLRSRMAFTRRRAAMIGLQFQRLPIAVGDEGVIAVSGEEGELGTWQLVSPRINAAHPPDAAPAGRPAWSGTGCKSSRRHRRRRPSSREWESSPPLVSPRSGPAGWRAGGW